MYKALYTRTRFTMETWISKSSNTCLVQAVLMGGHTLILKCSYIGLYGENLNKLTAWRPFVLSNE